MGPAKRAEHFLIVLRETFFYSERPRQCAHPRPRLPLECDVRWGWSMKCDPVRRVVLSEFQSRMCTVARHIADLPDFARYFHVNDIRYGEALVAAPRVLSTVPFWVANSGIYLEVDERRALAAILAFAEKESDGELYLTGVDGAYEVSRYETHALNSEVNCAESMALGGIETPRLIAPDVSLCRRVEGAFSGIRTDSCEKTWVRAFDDLGVPAVTVETSQEHCRDVAPLFLPTTNALVDMVRGAVETETGKGLPLHEAQELTARVFGARNWQCFIARRAQLYGLVPASLLKIEHKVDDSIRRVLLYPSFAEGLAGLIGVLRRASRKEGGWYPLEMKLRTETIVLGQTDRWDLSLRIVAAQPPEIVRSRLTMYLGRVDQLMASRAEEEALLPP